MPGDVRSNYLVGNYTVSKCRDTCQFQYILERCGSGSVMMRYLPHYKSFIKDAILLKYAKPKEACNGISKTIEEQKIICYSKCKLACVQTMYDATYEKFKLNPSPRFSTTYLSFKFENMLQEILTEEPAFSLATLVANFGGTMGLVIGASVLSFWEVVMFLVLVLLELVLMRYRTQSHDLDVEIGN